MNSNPINFQKKIIIPISSTFYSFSLFFVDFITFFSLIVVVHSADKSVQ